MSSPRNYNFGVLVSTSTCLCGSTEYLGYVSNCPGAGVPGCYANNVSSLTAIFQLQQYAQNWVERTLSSYPSVRYAVGMAYDAATSSIVLFGGSDFGLVAGDTWIWRNGWSQVSPAASPPARFSPGAAYDPTTRTVVLFGGTNANGIDLNDTWTWDGTTWTQQFPPVSPPARAFDAQSMVYDDATQTIVIFGGQGGNFGDTWEWNGRTKTWKQDFPPSSPSPRNTTFD